MHFIFLLILLFLADNCPSQGLLPASRPALTKAATRAAVHDFSFLREETFSCGGQTHTVSIYRHETTGLEFVLVPGGEFTMGSPVEESGRTDKEGPQRRVRVKPFLLCRTEVTQAAWDRVGGSDDRNWRGPDLPIERVSWSDIAEWCKKAGLRLPTEAEWEYACRAGTTSRFCFGDGDGELSNHAWYHGNSGNQTHPVGRKHPNAFGLFDMHGNVSELVEDIWPNCYDEAPTDGSARVGESMLRVRRGGSWSCIPPTCRSAHRWGVPMSRAFHLGFRPACTVPSQDPSSGAAERAPASRHASMPSTAGPVPGFIYLQHETFSCGGQTHTVAIYRHETTGLEFVLVPGGEFKMGSPADKESRSHPDEKPQHRVKMNPYLLCRTEVTKAVWRRLLGPDSSAWKGSNPNHPMEQVSWDDAQGWCRAVGLRLPTEAEWEYACRAGTTSRFFFGDDDRELPEYAWCNSNQTGPVGQKRPNAFGLYDMHGNVAEWVEDNWHGNYNGAPTDGRAWLGGSTHRVTRGGRWFGNSKTLYSSKRGFCPPGSCDYMGFRPACSLQSVDSDTRPSRRAVGADG